MLRIVLEMNKVPSLLGCQRPRSPFFNKTIREDRAFNLFLLRRAQGFGECDTYTQTESEAREQTSQVKVCTCGCVKETGG